MIAIVALISPYQKDRDEAPQAAESFFEIYISTPLEICEERDLKGLYRKAGDVDFTDISSPPISLL